MSGCILHQTKPGMLTYFDFFNSSNIVQRLNEFMSVLASFCILSAAAGQMCLCYISTNTV